MIKKIIIFIAVILIIFVVSIVWWQWRPQQPQKYTGPVEKITIATPVNQVSTLFQIAKVKDYFKEEGLEVALEPLTSGKATLNALKEGKAHFAVAGDIPIMFAVMAGDRIYTVAEVLKSDNDLTIVGKKTKGILLPTDLRGKRVGVTKGTSGEFFLSSFLIVHNIPFKEVEFIDLKPEEMLGAITTGSVDAVSTFQPHVVTIQKELGDQATSFTSENIYMVMINLVGRKDFVNQNPEIIKKILRALLKAEDFNKKNPTQSQSIVADYSKMDRAYLAQIWSDFDFTVSLEQTLILTLEDETRWAIKNKLTDQTKVPNYLDHIYFDALEAVKPEAVTIVH